MINGRVNERNEAVVRLTVQGPSGQNSQLDVVVDTGFSDFLFLPEQLAYELDLTYWTSQVVLLADGSRSRVDVYLVSVLWDGRWMRVYAQVADGTPLVGMLMLKGWDLNIEVEVGGRVTIQARA